MCQTLAERHHVLQAYLSAGSFFAPVLQVKEGPPFYCGLFSDVKDFGFTESNTNILMEVQFKGITFKVHTFCIDRL